MQEKKVVMALLMLVLVFGLVVTTLCGEGQADGVCHDARPIFIYCLSYFGLGPPPPRLCCEGVASMFESVNTPQRRRTVCQCLKNYTAFFRYDPEKAKQLPQYCNITSYFNIDPRQNCSSYAPLSQIRLAFVT
ncbi:Non-specific lipid-transfer protein AP10 [Spatholobus suberectus]|nr:Non-specific lipid-transfer protein AP10 [Spatholobus suberectus]